MCHPVHTHSIVYKGQPMRDTFLALGKVKEKCGNSLQGDTSHCFKPLVDTKKKLRLSTVHEPHTKTEILFRCQREVRNNLMCHPVVQVHSTLISSSSSDIDIGAVVIAVHDGEGGNGLKASSNTAVLIPKFVRVLALGRVVVHSVGIVYGEERVKN